MDSNKKYANLSQQLSFCFKRTLIAIPLVHRYPHQSLLKRAGLGAATLEFDTAAYPNIEYIAGTRMSVYPANRSEDVDRIMSKLVNDLPRSSGKRSSIGSSTGAHSPATKKQKPSNNQQQANFKDTPNPKKGENSESVSEQVNIFIKNYDKDGLKQCLTRLFDISGPPQVQVLRLIAEHAKSPVQRELLMDACKNTETWERWICNNEHLCTLRSILDEFSNGQVPALSLLSVLPYIQPRQYSISSIKSTKRFRTEILVAQHKFDASQIANSFQQNHYRETHAPVSPVTPSVGLESKINQRQVKDRTSKSLRSLRSVVFPAISTHQVKRVTSFSGPLVNRYASSTAGKKASGGKKVKQQTSPLHYSKQVSRSKTKVSSITSVENAPNAQKVDTKPFDGLCSNYLLNLKPGSDYVICEFIENPRFTLKGNRERPIMMIGQDIGVVAFRAFWQQRSLEFDRAQVFYTLFKDLSPKKFGEMNFVAITGGRCKIEELFRKEIVSMQTSKILTSSTNVDSKLLINLLNDAAAASNNPKDTHHDQQHQTQTSGGRSVKITSKELLDLGMRMAKLLAEANGCLYTCCDSQITQAIELLLIESLASLMQKTRDELVELLPRWKGGPPPTTDNHVFFKLENSYEKSQIVQEIYDSSI